MAAMDGGTGVTVANATFAYAGVAYSDTDCDQSYIFQNCQFEDCGTNIIVSGTSVNCLNVLSAQCGSFLAYSTVGGTCDLEAQCLTVDSATQFAVPAGDDGWWGPINGNIINSILN